jgi:CBS domain-containing protein
MASGSPWRRFLSELKVEDLLGSASTKELKADMTSRIAFLNKDDSIKEAVELMTVNKIISAPVYDDNSNRFIGFVDMLDLATLCIQRIAQSGGNVLEQRELEDMTVEKVIDLSGRNAWCPLDRTAPLHDLFATLCRPDVHRVPIIDSKVPEPEKKVLAIITQAELVRWLWVSREAAGFPREALAMKVNQMSSPAVHEFGKQRELVLVKETETALDAFLKIVERKVNGLGVISTTGELIGNISATDLRVVAATGWQDMLTMLSKQLNEFLSFKGSLMINLTDRASHPHPITVTPDETVESALEKLALNHIHRVWVIQGRTTGTGAAAEEEAQAKNVPIGCVSMTDIISELAGFNA